MKKLNKILLMAIITISLAACSDSADTEQVTETTSVEVVEVTEAAEELDINYSIASADSNEIELGDESIEITEAGTYYISGTLENGQIIIDCDDSDEVELVLSDVNINSNYSAAIYVKNADKVTITTESNSTLSISADISSNTDSVDGVIYSKSDLILNGTATLTINSEYTHGIVGKDDVEIENGSYIIDVEKDGIQANDSVTVIDADLTISSANDGIQVENDENTDKGYVYLENSNLVLNTGEDGINASNYVYILSGEYTIDAALDGIQADSYIQVDGGDFNITTGGGYQGVLNEITLGEGSSGVVSETDKLEDSMKAIKSYDIIVNQGDIVISSYEDGFNADNDIVINGGNININSGDEALTAKNTLEINDGTVVVENGYEGLEAVYVTINGGDVDINVLDDGINGGETYSVVTITGGNLTVACQGDGLDSNGDMVISGGYIVLDVDAIYSGGDGNVDVTGTLTYTGGTIVDESGNTIDPTQQSTMGGDRRH